MKVPHGGGGPAATPIGATSTTSTTSASTAAASEAGLRACGVSEIRSASGRVRRSRARDIGAWARSGTAAPSGGTEERSCQAAVKDLSLSNQRRKRESAAAAGREVRCGEGG